MDRGTIDRFIVRVQTLHYLLKGLTEIVGVGNQGSARAFSQRPQAGLRIRGPHRGNRVVTLPAVLAHDAGAGVQFGLLLALRRHLSHRQFAG